MVTKVVVVVTGMVAVLTMHPLEVKVYPALHVPQLPLDPMILPVVASPLVRVNSRFDETVALPPAALVSTVLVMRVCTS